MVVQGTDLRTREAQDFGTYFIGVPAETGPRSHRQPAHGAAFRFEDGFCVDGPAKGGRLDPVPVEVAGDSVMIGTP